MCLRGTVKFAFDRVHLMQGSTIAPIDRNSTADSAARYRCFGMIVAHEQLGRNRYPHIRTLPPPPVIPVAPAVAVRCSPGVFCRRVLTIHTVSVSPPRGLPAFDSRG